MGKKNKHKKQKSNDKQDINNQAEEVKVTVSMANQQANSFVTVQTPVIEPSKEKERKSKKTKASHSAELNAAEKEDPAVSENTDALALKRKRKREKQKQRKKSKKASESDMQPVPVVSTPKVELSQISQPKSKNFGTQTLESTLLQVSSNESAMKEQKSGLLELISCGICMDYLAKPHMVECGHTFCYSCLHTWTFSKANRLNGSCPACRKELKVKPILNIIMEELVDKLIVGLNDDKASKVAKEKEKFKSIMDPWLGWFSGGFGEKPIMDEEDGVARCGSCGWEIEDGVCLHCNISYLGHVPAELSEEEMAESSDMSQYDSDDGFVERTDESFGDEELGPGGYGDQYEALVNLVRQYERNDFEQRGYQSYDEEDIQPTHFDSSENDPIEISDGFDSDRRVDQTYNDDSEDSRYDGRLNEEGSDLEIERPTSRITRILDSDSDGN